MPNILLISSSTVFGRGYLDHVSAEIQDTLGKVRELLFVPFALFDVKAYAEKAHQRFEPLGCRLTSLHELAHEDRRKAVLNAGALFIGGGNTFRLLQSLYHDGLLEPIRKRVESGMPYVGSSAGSIVAGPSIKTTKDMPIVYPPSFDALGIFPFQISPHYLDPDPKSTHMGETQEERIMQFLEENATPVVGLREGSFIRYQNGQAVLKGELTARFFVREREPREIRPGTSISA